MKRDSFASRWTAMLPNAKQERAQVMQSLISVPHHVPQHSLSVWIVFHALIRAGNVSYQIIFSSSNHNCIVGFFFRGFSLNLKWTNLTKYLENGCDKACKCHAVLWAAGVCLKPKWQFMWEFFLIFETVKKGKEDLSSTNQMCCCLMLHWSQSMPLQPFLFQSFMMN